VKLHYQVNSTFEPKYTQTLLDQSRISRLKPIVFIEFLVLSSIVVEDEFRSWTPRGEGLYPSKFRTKVLLESVKR